MSKKLSFTKGLLQLLVKFKRIKDRNELLKMYLHSAELNVVAVTENVNTFLLVWTHVSRYGVNWLYCYQVYKVLTVVMYSSQLSNDQLLKCRPIVISHEAFSSSKTSFVLVYLLSRENLHKNTTLRWRSLRQLLLVFRNLKRKATRSS